MQRSDPGFDPASLLTFRVELGWAAYPDLAASSRFQRELLAQLEGLPGVRSAAMAGNLPLAGRPKFDVAVMLEGQDDEAQRRNPFVNRRIVSPSFFETLRVPLRRGRTFTSADGASAPRVAVVSEAAARRLWPGRDPIGARLRASSTDFRLRDPAKIPWLTVVGVVGDVRHESPRGAPSLDVYVPGTQEHTGSHYFVLRTDSDPLALAREATALVGRLDPDQSFFDLRTMEERVADRTWAPRLAGVLFGAFGALAAVLAAIRAYAVLAFTVAQRRHELGVRQALGATPRDIARLILGDGLRLTLAGLAIGLCAALAAARLLAHLLHEVAPADLPTFVAVPALMLAVSAAASAIPAWRAARVDPVDAMRK